MDRRRTLTDSLLAHRAADPLEGSHRARMLALLAAPGDPFDREQHDPGHFTASAWVLGPDTRTVLLVYHSRLYRWLQPGGHVEPEDRDLAHAARREVAEETGLTGLAPSATLFDLDVHPIPAKGAEPEHLHFDVRYLLRSTETGVRAGSDAREVRWFPIGELGDLGDEPAVARVAKKLCDPSSFLQETDR